MPAANIKKFIRHIFCKGQIVEIRIPKGGRDGTISGFFDNGAALSAAAASVAGKYPGIYYTLNPVSPDMFGKSPNKLTANAERNSLAHDAQIASRRWLLIDVDPLRPADVSSTDAEHDAAIAKSFAIRDFLSDAGWPLPIVADSGNGAHLLYRVDLPNDEPSKLLIRGVLQRLAADFDDEHSQVDRKVYNASRICKVYGTLSCKGANTEERPHRWSALLDVPDAVEIVSAELLAGMQPAASAAPNIPGSTPNITAPNKYVSNAINSAIARIISAAPGTRNDTLNSEAFGIAQLCAGGEINESEAFALIERAALGAGLDKAEVRATMLSAFDAGKLSPRNAPEMRRRPEISTPVLQRQIDQDTGEILDHPDTAEPLGKITSWLQSEAKLKIIGRDADDGIWLIKPGSTEPAHYKAAKLMKKSELISLMPKKLLDELVMFSGQGDRFTAESAASALMLAAAENPIFKQQSAQPVQSGTDMLTGNQGVDSFTLARKMQQLTIFDVPSQSWWRWDTVWRRIDDEAVRKVIVAEVDRDLGSECENSYVNGTLSLLKTRLSRISDSNDIWEDDRHLLPMHNGVLNMRTGQIIPHSPDFLFNWVMPHHYDPEAECPTVQNFISNLSGGDASTESVLYAFLAAVLFGRYDLERYLEFVGMAGTGKSTYIALCRELVGGENTHVTDMKTLHNNQFETANIHGKRLVMISDADKYGGDVGIFKQITGRDMVRREEKHSQAQKGFIYKGMVIVAANNPIQIADNSTAMVRRRVPVHIDKKLDKKLVDYQLSSKLTSEIPGLINLLLRWSHDEVSAILSDAGGHRKHSIMRAMIETNAIAAWANECLVVDIDAEAQIGKLGADADSNLYPNYSQYCEQTGRRGVVTLNTFSRSLLDIFETAEIKVFMKRKKSGMHMQGIRLRNELFDSNKPDLLT